MLVIELRECLCKVVAMLIQGTGEGFCVTFTTRDSFDAASLQVPDLGRQSQCRAIDGVRGIFLVDLHALVELIQLSVVFFCSFIGLVANMFVVALYSCCESLRSRSTIRKKNRIFLVRVSPLTYPLRFKL